MRIVERWSTFNGHEHTSKEEALYHLNELRGELICKLAKKIVAGDFKYSDVIRVLDQNIDYLAEELTKINNDMESDGTDQDS
jgi:ribosome biogenesis protein Nip4